MKNKNIKVYIILCIFALVLLGFIVAFNLITVSKSNLCINCHKNKKEKGKNYCTECLLEAKKELEKQKNEGTENKTTGNSDNEEVNLIIDTSSPDPKKTPSNSNKDIKQSTGTSTAEPKETDSKSDKDSKKKTYNELNYDPADYDDPDDYAEDAWGEDFDDYDDAYDYWEDY